MAAKKETEDAREALDVNIDASTKTIKAQFRRKARDLQNKRAGGTPASRKSFEELNNAYLTLIENRKQGQSAPTKSVTILSSDVAGYSRMMATNEAETLEFFHFCKEVFEEIVAENQGRVFNTAGDAILAEFEYVFNAIHCAVEIQKELRAINLGQPEDKRVLFRMGINKGEVFMQEGDLLGDAVNIAARLQTAAKPGGICLSGEIYDQVANKVSHGFTNLGKLAFKNIPEPVRTYALTEDDGKFKPPLPNLNATPFAAPTLPEKNRKKTLEEASGNGLRNVLLVGAVLAAGAFYLWKQPSGETAARPAAVASSSAALLPGHVFLAPTPDAVVTLSLNDKPVFQGPTPAMVDVAPATYEMRIENRDAGILEQEILVVESGASVRFEKDFTPKSTAASGSGFVSVASAQLTPEEAELLHKAQETEDAETGFRSAKALLDKGDANSAYEFLWRAAAKNHGQAQYELGKLFYTGKGKVKRDFDAAIYWLLKAGLNGRNEATSYLSSHNFPPEYKTNITNQQYISTGDPKYTRQRTAQTEFLESKLKPLMTEKNLPK